MSLNFGILARGHRSPGFQHDHVVLHGSPRPSDARQRRFPLALPFLCAYTPPRLLISLLVASLTDSRCESIGSIRIDFFSPLQPLRDAKPLLRGSCMFSNPPTLSSFKDLTANSAVPFQGASGATYGTIAFFAAAMPRATFLLFFVVPVPAWVSNHNLFRHSSGSLTRADGF